MAFRKPLNITSRTSSITNCFVQAIIPHVPPTEADVSEALFVLGMTAADKRCAYCGVPATDWDHLRPLVRNKRPTGYIDEIRNLVPACGPCNHSKGASDWRVWMQGKAPGSPKTRNVANLSDLIDHLDKFERWGKVEPLPLRDWAGAENWDAHWANLEKIEQEMKSAQIHAAALRSVIQAKIEFTLFAVSTYGPDLRL